MVKNKQLQEEIIKLTKSRNAWRTYGIVVLIILLFVYSFWVGGI